MKGNRGFSLIEIVVVIGLLAIIGGFFMLTNIDTYRSYLFRGERDNIVEALQKARSRAINNICFGASCSNGRPHGVRFESGGDFIIFQAPYSSSDSTNDKMSLIYGTTITDSVPFEITFSQLSGDSSVERDITIVDDIGHISVISINNEGQILWSN